MVFGRCSCCRQETLRPLRVLRFQGDEEIRLCLVLECTTCGRAKVGTGALELKV